VWAFTRTLDDRALLVLANCSSEPATVDPGSIPDLTGSEVLLPTHAPSYDLTLRPWESRLHRH
jgi:oligo-1,6-glucosidase